MKPTFRDRLLSSELLSDDHRRPVVIPITPKPRPWPLAERIGATFIAAIIGLVIGYAWATAQQQRREDLQRQEVAAELRADFRRETGLDWMGAE